MRSTLTKLHHFDYHRVSTEHATLAGAYGAGAFVPHTIGGLLLMVAYLFIAGLLLLKG